MKDYSNAMHKLYFFNLNNSLFKFFYVTCLYYFYDVHRLCYEYFMKMKRMLEKRERKMMCGLWMMCGQSHVFKCFCLMNG